LGIQQILRQIGSALESDALPQLLQLLKDHVTSMEGAILPSMVHLQIVQSGYVSGSFVPTLSHCKKLENGSTVIQDTTEDESGQMSRSRNRVFGIGWERPGQYKKQSFVVMRGNDEGGRVLWVGKILLLFRLSYTGSSETEEFAYVQYMEVSKPISGVDRALGCVCLRRATEDELDRTLDVERSLSGSKVEAG